MTKKGSLSTASSSTADNGPSGGGPGPGRFVCAMCAKVYRSGAGLRYHKRKRHRGKLVLSEKEIFIFQPKLIEYRKFIFILNYKII